MQKNQWKRAGNEGIVKVTVWNSEHKGPEQCQNPWWCPWWPGDSCWTLPCLQGFSHPHNEATFCPTRFVPCFPICLRASHSYFKCMHIALLSSNYCVMNAYTLYIVLWYDISSPLAFTPVPFLSTNPLSVCSAARVYHMHPPPVAPCCVAVRIFCQSNHIVSLPELRDNATCPVIPSALVTLKRKRISCKDLLTPDWPVAYEEAKYIPSILHYADINLCRC